MKISTAAYPNGFSSVRNFSPSRKNGRRTLIFRERDRFSRGLEPHSDLVCRPLGHRAHHDRFYSCLPGFDLGANRSEAEVADILNKQMPLLRHGFLPYVPFELIQKRVFVTDTKPLPVLTRRPDGAYERASLPTRENDLRFLAQLLNAFGLTAVLLLLLDKHGIVNLWY